MKIIGSPSAWYLAVTDDGKIKAVVYPKPEVARHIQRELLDYLSRWGLEIIG